MKSLRYILPALIVIAFSCTQGEKKSESITSDQGVIKPWSEDPRYWEYKGEQVLLLGGSKDDNLFQIPFLEEHLDELQAVGGNYIRNTLSARDSGNVLRFLVQPDGLYDLEKWNPEYWERFEKMLELTSERDIIVQLEIWDRFDYSRDSWTENPWKPQYNVNYTAEETGLAETYPDHPGKDNQPFFHSIPGMPMYTEGLDVVRSFQEKYIDKLLSYTLNYGNVLYCIDNETSTPPEWGRYWIAYIDSVAKAKDREIYLTDMFDQFFSPQNCPSCIDVLENADIYTFIDVSQINGRNYNQNHWDTLQWILNERDKYPLRPVNNTKIYGTEHTSWATGSMDGVERFCRNVMGGCASVRHHRPIWGNGLNEDAQASIKAVRKVETLVKLWEVTPRMDLLSDREENEAYLTAAEGEKYIIYFTHGGAVDLDVGCYDKPFMLNWVSVNNGEWGEESSFQGGTAIEVSAPDLGGWFAVITKSKQKKVETKTMDKGNIKPWSENPRYWEYKGEPVLLLGGSKDDNLYQIQDLEKHLDELQAIDGNYIRNTLSDRDTGNIQRFLAQPNGLYDLDKWDPEYWQIFENMLALCSERDIIIQLEIWDRFDYSRANWIESPWNPENNVNYTVGESGLAEVYPYHPVDDRQPFFHSIPGMPNYTEELDIVRSYQEKYIDKLLSFTLNYGNVLYCMDNETSTPVEWGKYWISYIDSIAAERGTEVFLTDMFGFFYSPQTCPPCLEVLKNPDIYSFIDVSQINSLHSNQAHWDTLQWIITERDKYALRPVNNTKIYGGEESIWGSGSNEDGVERFCRNVLGGCASVRHHRPDHGNGLNEKAKSSIKAIRKVETLVKFWELTPRMDLLSEREKNEAYLAAHEGEKYIIYFTHGGAVDLDLRQHDQTFVLNWISVDSGEWGEKSSITGGNTETVTAPGQGGWFAVIKK